MRKVIVFDFDFTLGDSANGIAQSINYALEQLGHAARGMDEIKTTIGLSLKDTYAALTGSHDTEKAAAFAKYFKEKADQVMVENTILYSGVKETLAKLKEKGCKTAVVTSKFHYRIEQILSKFDAQSLIDVIVGAEDVKAEKPAPEGLLWAIEHLGAQKNDVLYVGDSIVDAQTAENAGVAFAAVLTGATGKAAFEKHSHIYIGSDVTDVCRAVLSIE